MQDPEEEEQAHNPYLYDCSGPKSKTLQPEVNEGEGLYDFDMGSVQASFGADGGYSVKHQNEKFSLGGGKESAQTQEERELAEALEKIR